MKTFFIVIVALLTVSVAQAEDASHAAAAIMAGILPPATSNPAANTPDVNAKIQRVMNACFQGQPSAASTTSSVPATSGYRY